MEIINKAKTNIKWIIAYSSAIIFLIIMLGIIKNKVLSIDIWTIDNIIYNIRTSWLTSFFKVFTFFGEAKLLIPVGFIGAFIGFFVFKDKLRASCYILNLIAIAGMNWTIKHIIQRPRPETSLRLVQESGYSFPSGHAMVSTAFYGLIIYYLWNHIRNEKLRNIICAVICFLVVMIDFSRVYLGVHYVSDVLAGSLLSISYLIFAVEIAKKYLFKKQ